MFLLPSRRNNTHPLREPPSISLRVFEVGPLRALGLGLYVWLLWALTRATPGNEFAFLGTWALRVWFFLMCEYLVWVFGLYVLWETTGTNACPLMGCIALLRLRGPFFFLPRWKEISIFRRPGIPWETISPRGETRRVLRLRGKEWRLAIQNPRKKTETP